jgi:hypothetical protein
MITPTWSGVGILKRRREMEHMGRVLSCLRSSVAQMGVPSFVLVFTFVSARIHPCPVNTKSCLTFSDVSPKILYIQIC